MSETARLRQSIANLTKRLGILEVKVAKGITSGGSGSGSYDADSNAGFVAAGITDTVIKDAIDTLILGLKANSLWTKIKGLYPLAGGTTLSTSINFKTPNTGDLSFHPSAAVIATGLQGLGGPYTAAVNGTSFDYIVDSNNSCGLYSRTNIAQEVSDFLCSLGVTNYWNMHMQWSNGRAYADCYKVTSEGRLDGPVTDSLGHYYMSRIGASMWFIKNNVTISGPNVTAGDIGSLPNTTIAIGASGSTKNYAFFWFGDGLFPAELTIMNSLVQAYIIAMGR